MRALALLLGLCAVPSAARAEGFAVASLGPDEATFQWQTVDATPSVVRIRPAAGGEPAGTDAEEGEWRLVEGSGGPSRFHVVDVEGLQPDARYEYRLGEGDVGPSGTLTTLAPPAGDPRAVLYVLADIHLCVEDCADGVRRLSASRDAYVAALADIERRAAALPQGLPRALVILGDLSQQPRPAEWDAAAAVEHPGLPICLIPGNHEGWDEEWARRMGETEERLASPECRYDGSRGILDLDGWRILLLSSLVPGENWGELGDEQREWLDARLAEAPERPTLLAVHVPYLAHPAALVLGRGTRFAFLRDADALEAVLARHRQVVAVLSGHLHVNWTGQHDDVTQLLFSALAQYPMGYHSLTLYDGGLVRRYHPLAATAEEAEQSARELRRWAESEGVPLAAAVPGLVYGGTQDRNVVVAATAADSPPEPRASASGPSPSPPTTTAAGAPSEARESTGTTPTSAPTPTSGGGCRCAAATTDEPWGAVVLAAAAIAAWPLRRGRRTWTAKRVGKDG
jgi:hypothetical protein